MIYFKQIYGILAIGIKKLDAIVLIKVGVL